ncbi:MAG: adenylate/guanylate cyclase domain-containing protein, partial [Rhodospirillaceae bacterium]|nr:adenylate/guanylate cyclase domain-containing protein [Rhodospirillaceae bacterium]
MTEEKVQRKLAAILAADVVGYSRLMDVDEESTLHTLRAHRQIIDGLISTHNGRVFATGGDSVIAEFTSPVEAVRCAVQIQLNLEKSNVDLPKDRLMIFRIGVNLGDIMIEGDDLLGDGVNVAARLEGIADQGGICISGTVYDQVLGKISQAFEF